MFWIDFEFLMKILVNFMQNLTSFVIIMLFLNKFSFLRKNDEKILSFCLCFCDFAEF